ncbi:MAG TPA: extracellular solute-binding protein [Anaeromyxobacteraceae bacterium]|nr:extracellular solute-binding protein [Anaeromyxobacteraceae bacterium]
MLWSLLFFASAVAGPAPAASPEDVLTVYSARHYQSDRELFEDFTRRTGIRVNLVQGGEDELLERIRSEGASGPADVFITVDAARLGEADQMGLFAPVRSEVLERRIPANLRTATWFAFSKRARLIVFHKASTARADVQTYEDLAAPRLKGKVCVRSGAHPYNVSLGAAMITHLGEEGTERWARGLVANFARAPTGGDTDQIRAVASGECQVALVNSYYLARLMRSDKPWDRDAVSRIGVVWPNQRKRGTHVNVSAGGVLRTARHPDAAVKLLEFLTSDSAQVRFADADNEWPVARTARVSNPALERLGTFKTDSLDVGTLARNAPLARQIFARAGWR